MQAPQDNVEVRGFSDKQAGGENGDESWYGQANVKEELPYHFQTEGQQASYVYLYDNSEPTMPTSMMPPSADQILYLPPQSNLPYDEFVPRLAYNPYQQGPAMPAYGMPMFQPTTGILPPPQSQVGPPGLQHRGGFGAAASIAHRQPIRRELQKLQHSFGGMSVQQQGTSTAKARGEIDRGSTGESSRSTFSTHGMPTSLPPKPAFASPILDSGIVDKSASGRMSATDARRSSTVAAPKPAPTVPLSARLPNMSPLPELHDLDKPQLVKLIMQREEQFMLRIEAMGFEPDSAWKLWKELSSDGQAPPTFTREQAAPVLGIRLLQRLDALQRENTELESIIKDGMSNATSGNGSATLAKDIEDAHKLIDELDRALTASQNDNEAMQKKVIALEQALTAACSQNSSATSAENLTKQSETGKRGRARGGGGRGGGTWTRRT